MQKETPIRKQVASRRCLVSIARLLSNPLRCEVQKLLHCGKTKSELPPSYAPHGMLATLA